MHRKRMIIVLVVLIIALVGCGKQTDIDETTQTTAAPTVELPTETTAVQETIPGLEDSEFDDETEPTAEETQPQTESTELTETIKPTEAPKPQGTTKPTEAPKPQETTPPTQPSTKPQTEYERFQNMSAADQPAHIESFDNMDAFFNWYNNAKAEYEAANPPIDVGSGSIDMGELMG